MGDDFVLNVLGEQESGPTMRHFLKRFPAGADRFEGVETLNAKNGSPVLRSAIAHIELKVRSLVFFQLRVNIANGIMSCLLGLADTCSG